MGKNNIIFGVDMSSSMHIDNKNKDTLILSGGPQKGLDDRILTAEAICPVNFTQPNKSIKSALLLEASYLLMLQKYINSKQKSLK